MRAPRHKHVHRVVLDSLMGGIGVVAQAGARSPHLVGRHRGPDAAPADNDPSLGLTVSDGPGHRERKVRIVVQRVVLVGPEVSDLVPAGLQQLANLLLQIEAGMVRADRNLRQERF